MKSRINKLLEEISAKRQELGGEYAKLKEKYGFRIEGKKIIFNIDTKKKNKSLRKTLVETIFTAEVCEILSIPFIYSMIVPAVFLDIFLFVYQQTAFRLYRIPIVKRGDYIIFDRRMLDYLNVLQKFNCMYCSYVNGLFQYAVEVGGRTEKYWCPIKNARKKSGEHDWEKNFADYGDPVEFRKIFHSTEEFKNMGKEENKEM